LDRKNEKTASAEIGFIQKLRDILSIGDRCFKDESPIFPTSTVKVAHIFRTEMALDRRIYS
jgi:hypothetical protein